MKTKHTPGPWEAQSIGQGYSVRGDGNGHCVAFTNAASCSKAALRRNVTKQDEEQANATLLAAAPEMLEALAGVLPYMEKAEIAGLVGDEGCHWPVEAVRAAIKKALHT